jgi:hypothetical protein
MLRRAKARLLYNRTQITLILLDVHGLKFSRHCDPANGGGSNLSNFQQKTISARRGGFLRPATGGTRKECVCFS